MATTIQPPSEYRAMWLLAMFDLPVTEKKERKEYSAFRKNLMGEGFSMMQYSVYARYCKSEEASLAFKNRITKNLPPAGQVRLVAITDKQFGKMDVFQGKKCVEIEDPPDQLMLF